MSEEAASTASKNNTGLVTREERNIGAVSWQVHKKHILSGGGHAKIIFLCSMFVLCAANSFMSNRWMSMWKADANYSNNSRFFCLGHYALFSITPGIFSFF